MCPRTQLVVRLKFLKIRQCRASSRRDGAKPAYLLFMTAIATQRSVLAVQTMSLSSINHLHFYSQCLLIKRGFSTGSCLAVPQGIRNPVELIRGTLQVGTE